MEFDMNGMVGTWVWKDAQGLLNGGNVNACRLYETKISITCTLIVIHLKTDQPSNASPYILPQSATKTLGKLFIHIHWIAIILRLTLSCLSILLRLSFSSSFFCADVCHFLGCSHNASDNSKRPTSKFKSAIDVSSRQKEELEPTPTTSRSGCTNQGGFCIPL